MKITTDTRGNAATEFAIVLPLFMMLLGGILFYGLYFGAVNAVQQIAAESARAAVAGLDTAERTNLARTRAYSDATLSLLLDPDKMNVAVTDGPNGIRVTISYDTSTMPIWVLEGLLPVPEKVVERVSVIEQGG